MSHTLSPVLLSRRGSDYMHFFLLLQLRVQIFLRRFFFTGACAILIFFFFSKVHKVVVHVFPYMVRVVQIFGEKP